MFRNTQDYIGSATPLVPSQVGQRVNVQARNGKRTMGLLLVITATVTLAAGPATAIRNRGSLAALVDFIGWNENGVDKVLCDGRSLRALGELYSALPLSATRLDNLANGAYDLSETIYVPFANKYLANAVETAFREADPNQALSFFVVFNNDGTRLAATPGTVTVTNFTVDAVQDYDDQRAQLGIYSPFVRQIVQPISSAAPNLPLYLKSSRRIAGLVIQQTTSDVGEVSDIISALSIRGDFMDIVGPAQMPYDAFQRIMEPGHGGISDDALTAGYGFFDFIQGGRLSTILDPSKDPNFRLEVNVTPSVTGANSTLVVTLLEMEERPGLTIPPAARPWVAAKA